MSVEKIRKQHSDYNRLFEERYDELADLWSSVKEAIRTLVAQNEVEEEAATWALNTLDTPTLFRFYKKYKWNRVTTVSAIIANAIWRIHTIPTLPIPTPTETPLLRLIDASDSFGRPIMIIRARHIPGKPIPDIKSELLTAYELARIHIGYLYSQCHDVVGSSAQLERILQFTIIADLDGLGIRQVPMDLIPWLGQTLIPNFPGVVGPAYVVNYSWTFNGVWQMAKQMLPQRAIDRIVFPSISELSDHIPSASLLQEYGGTLPSTKLKKDVVTKRHLHILHPNMDIDISHSVSSAASSSSEESPEETPAAFAPPEIVAGSPPAPLPPAIPRISTRSNLNPYFGYPVSYITTGPNQVPRLVAGRRRKRDLAKTLLILLFHRLINTIPNIFLRPVAPHAVSHLHEVGIGPLRWAYRRKWRAWVWWALFLWLAATIRRIVRFRAGRLVNGVISADARLRNVWLSLIVGGEFVRRGWIALGMTGEAARLAAPLLV
ncbi:CRAL/TRIO domain-containing protein [Clavulina sp. PMI_390]|nr:CRAL/TRIO domain-containing protein [Clavulina sp. PMI_390]